MLPHQPPVKNPQTVNHSPKELNFPSAQVQQNFSSHRSLQPCSLPSPLQTTTPAQSSPNHISVENSDSITSEQPQRLASCIPRYAPSGIPRLALTRKNNAVSSPTSPTTIINASYLEGNSANCVQNGATYLSNHAILPDPSKAFERELSATSDLNHHSSLNDANNYEVHSNSRSRGQIRSNARSNRANSEYPQRQNDTESDTSSVFSSSGPPKVITSKIGSLRNVKHKPGGGAVKIHDEKVQIGPIKSKCNSLANVKHKPGGGNVQIVDQKLDFSNVTQSKVKSFQNVKHVPGGGDKQVFSETLEFTKNAKPKVGSLKNAHYQPGGGDVKIFNEHLPWLKYNKPNLPVEEKARINKHSTGGSHSDMNNSYTSGSTGR